MHILDLAQNSISAQARSIVIKVIEKAGDNKLEIEINDDGVGMSELEVKKVLDPFVTSRNTRRVGLGLPLIKQTAELCNGGILLSSESNRGTTVRAFFQIDHIDRPPLGDMAETVAVMVAANPEVDFKYIHQCGEKEFVFDTLQVRTAIKELPINSPAVLNWIKEFVNQGIERIGGGA